MSYQTKVYRQQGADAIIVEDGGSITVKSGGTIELEDGATLDGTLVTDIVNAVFTAAGSVTTAEVNAGKVVLAADADFTLKIVGIYLQAIGGAATAATSVDVADSDGTVFAAMPVASLTQNTVAAMNSAAITDISASLAAGKGIKIQKGGETPLATCSSVKYIIEYTKTAA